MSKIPLQKNDSNDPITRAISFIKLHFTENPKLEKVASLAYLTPSHFTTILKKQTGFSYTEYLTNLKISYAKNLNIFHEYKTDETKILSFHANVNKV